VTFFQACVLSTYHQPKSLIQPEKNLDFSAKNANVFDIAFQIEGRRIRLMFPNTGWSRRGKGAVPARLNQPASQKYLTVRIYSPDSQRPVSP